jgi:hypothetical protein
LERTSSRAPATKECPKSLVFSNFGVRPSVGAVEAAQNFVLRELRRRFVIAAFEVGSIGANPYQLCRPSAFYSAARITSATRPGTATLY